jgi:carbamoyltransferase
VFIADGSGGSTLDDGDILLRGPALREYLKKPLDSPAEHVESTYEFDRCGARLLNRVTAPSFNVFSGSSSPGEVYAAVSRYVFGSWHDSGKLMGLAPYGDASTISSFLQNDGERINFSRVWQNQYREALHDKAPMLHKDLAARIQDDFECAVFDHVCSALRRSGNKNLAYGGGLALNICTNERIVNASGARSVFILPASHEAGNAIGAAAAASFLIRKNTSRIHVTSDFLGKEYDTHAIDESIASFGAHLVVKYWQEEDLVDRLIRGETLGWFQGGAELGPRALGHRSILAAPHESSTWLRINREIKFREDFRPFAPIVPWELADRFFHISEPSPFMLRAIKVRDEVAPHLRAVTHVDGTARVQTLTQDTNPRLHSLLCTYGRRTGFPILLNTSLNVRGVPIVETPTEAIEMLLSTLLDSLVLEDRLVTVVPEALSPDSILVLAPCTELIHCKTRHSESFKLIAHARSRKEYALPKWAFELFAAFDGKTPLQFVAENTIFSINDDAACEFVRSFINERILLSCSVNNVVS